MAEARAKVRLAKAVFDRMVINVFIVVFFLFRPVILGAFQIGNVRTP